MIILILIVLGLCLGSFVNALVWRVREQELQAEKKTPDTKYLKKLSVTQGRSMCPHCKHELAGKDLIPVLSWLSLGGKCRYCKKPISVQYPLVEATTALLFVASYLFWPVEFDAAQTILLGIWLVILTGLIALTVYDLHWKLLPNRIMYPLGVLATVYASIAILIAEEPFEAFLGTVFGVIIGGGIFYALFQFSDGKWIGGGDVKLGWLLGLLVASPTRSLLFIFLASIIGSLVSIPLLTSHKLKRTSTIPFGPFLIAGAIIVMFFGADILNWYKDYILAI